MSLADDMSPIRVKILKRSSTPAVSRSPAAEPHSRSCCRHSPWAAATSVSPAPARPRARGLSTPWCRGVPRAERCAGTACLAQTDVGWSEQPGRTLWSPTPVQQPQRGFQSNQHRTRTRQVLIHTLSSEMGKKNKDMWVMGPQRVRVYLSSSGR